VGSLTSHNSIGLHACYGDNFTFYLRKIRAVILESVDGCRIEQYLRITADNAWGSNIKRESRMSGRGYIYIYLATESFVKETYAPGDINISDAFVQCRRRASWRPDELCSAMHYPTCLTNLWYRQCLPLGHQQSQSALPLTPD
jgi:hypothetical protein